MESQVHSSGGNTEEAIEHASLTQRQKEYLDAYKATRSAAKAASALGVSTDSARDSLRCIARKLGVASIRQLADDDVNPPVGQEATTAVRLMQIIERQDYRCALSGQKLTPGTAELDHIKPRSRGGGDEAENLQWLDKRINRMKGQMAQEEFVDCCQKAVAWLR